jgi:hypothetical protein
MLGADFVLASDGYTERLRQLLAPAGKRVVAVAMRNRLTSDWRRMLARGPVYVVVVDPRSLAAYDAASLGEAAAGIRPLVVGRDDVREIPPASYVYVSRSARRRLGTTAIPGRIVPTERAFAADTVREVLGLVVTANLQAMVS